MYGTGASAQAREIAEQLIAYESIAEQNPEALPAVFEVCEKLRRSLSILTGAEGFRSLLVRALALAQREADCLDGVQVKDDGSLEGFSDNAMQSGGAMLVGELLGLLMAFIGDELTMRMLSGIWPGLGNDRLNVATPGKWASKGSALDEILGRAGNVSPLVLTDA
jgi:hypothetical protein